MSLMSTAAARLAKTESRAVARVIDAEAVATSKRYFADRARDFGRDYAVLGALSDRSTTQVRERGFVLATGVVGRLKAFCRDLCHALGSKDGRAAAQEALARATASPEAAAALRLAEHPRSPKALAEFQSAFDLLYPRGIVDPASRPLHRQIGQEVRVLDRAIDRAANAPLARRELRVAKQELASLRDLSIANAASRTPEGQQALGVVLAEAIANRPALPRG